MFTPRQVGRRASAVWAKRRPPPVAVAQPDGNRQEQQPAKRQRLDGVSGLSAAETAPITVAVDNGNRIYYEEIRCGLELLLSDYAYTEPESKKWLLERERRVGGEEGCMCPSGILRVHWRRLLTIGYL